MRRGGAKGKNNPLRDSLILDCNSDTSRYINRIRRTEFIEQKIHGQRLDEFD